MAEVKPVPIANPAPLGLSGFALTTFVLSLIGHLVYGGMLGLVMWRTGMNVRPYAPDLLRFSTPAATAQPSAAGLQAQPVYASQDV